MGIHTGTAELEGEDYKASHTLNRAARIMSAGYGGQILISGAVAELLHGQLPGGIKLKDLGEHSLKGLTLPEHIFQVCDPGLPVDFPPLISAELTPHNLPHQATPFVGRRREVDQIKQMISRAEVRLLTLTGPGGVGKTRLALQVAEEFLDDFPNGVFYVELASIRDPGLIPSAVAQTLGIHLSGSQTAEEALKDYLCGKCILLVLDSFERVVKAAPFVSDLLASAPCIKVLVTSRVLLRLYAEQDYPVPPLEVPDLKDLPQLDRLCDSEAVQLFLMHARAVKPNFELTPGNAHAVVTVCTRIDGLPLAIELAAARIRLFTPQKMLIQLEKRFQLLSDGPRDLPRRQRSLLNALEWSSNLLGPNESTLFRRLGVFVGGCTIEAAEKVCNIAGDLDIISGLSSLVDNSLIKQVEQNGEPRFTMLETIREYALDLMKASGETENLYCRHLDFFTSLAETGGPQMLRGEDALWGGLLDADRDNLRAALAWSLRRADASDPDLHLGARLASGMWPYWYLRGHLAEGRGWLKSALDKIPESGILRARLLTAAAGLAWQQGDYADSHPQFEESIAIWRTLEDTSGQAEALHWFGHLTFDQQDYRKARQLFAESLEIYQDLEDETAYTTLVGDMGMVAYHQGDYTTARGCYEQSLKYFQAQGHQSGIAQMLIRLADLARLEGDYCQAGSLYEQSLARCREVQAQLECASALHKLGFIAQYHGDMTKAEALFKESLTMQREAGNKQGIAECLAGLAGVAAVAGQFERGATLFGAAEALLETVGAPLAPADRAEWERDVAMMRNQFDSAGLREAWDAGRSMPLERAFHYALEQILNNP